MIVFLGPKDVAARLGISERNAARLMKRGEIPSFRAGVKPWRTTELHLESYAIRRTLEQQNAFPPAADVHLKHPTSGLPQSHVEIIPRPPGGGLVIGQRFFRRKDGSVPGSRGRKPA